MTNGLVMALSIIGQQNNKHDQTFAIGAIAFACKKQLGL